MSLPEITTTSRPGTAVQRRTLLRTAAWTAPAVALAAATPAYATSGAEPVVVRSCAANTAYAVRWNTGTWSYTAASNGLSGSGNIRATTVTTLPAGTASDPLTVTVTNAFRGNMRGRTDGNQGNMKVTPHNVGGFSRPGLELWNQLTSNAARNAAALRNDRQDVTVDFGRQVTNVTFTITDIDAYKVRDALWFTSAAYQYIDGVHLDVAAMNGGSRAARVTGEGTSASPWFSSVAPATSGSSLDNTTGNKGNVQVTLPGPLRSFTLSFFNNEARILENNGSQAIYLSDLAFQANTCA